ncbi:MAG: ATP-binding cassette domain-containing protein, partial [Cyanobacteria bacterium P01_F01_bin.3]
MKIGVMSENRPIITIRNLNHYYGEGALRRQVLFNIDLEIKRGEFVIMTGPSGSGKSTLLSLIGCLRTVQDGSLRVLGQELQLAKGAVRKHVRRQFGYIFQTSNLVEFLTAERNLHLALELHHGNNRKQIHHKTQAILEAVQLGEYGRQYPRQLSGGQRQRIAIACALVSAPQLLLADEPTAALDRKSGRAIVELMRDLAKKQGSAILMVTHDPRILDVADRIIRVEDGKLKRDYRQEIAIALPGLHEQQLEELEVDPDIQTFQPGQYVVRQGEWAEHVYFLVDGTLEVLLDTTKNHKSQTRQLRVLKRGDYFGEIGLLRNEKRTASVRVTPDQKATVILLKRGAFLSLMQQSKSTETLITQQVQQRLLLTRIATALPQANIQSIIN